MSREMAFLKVEGISKSFKEVVSRTEKPSGSDKVYWVLGHLSSGA